MSDYKRPVAVVLGASCGIGNACARALSGDGYQVHGVSRTIDNDGAFEQVRADLTDTVGAAAAEDLIRECNPDALIFCVGETIPDNITNVDISITRRLLEVNTLSILGPLRVLVSELPSKPRSVVLISSIHARGEFDRLSYSLSKAALEAIMNSSYDFLMRHHIRINCIRPGPTETKMLLERFPVGSAERDSYLKEIPANRFAETGEIVELVRFLSGSRSQYLTGQVIGIAGGF